MSKKRVDVLSSGDVDFKDMQSYLYLSKTKGHHSYFLFIKMLDLIDSELKFIKSNEYYKKAQLPENVSELMHTSRQNGTYSKLNTKLLKEVQAFFKEYLPSESVELVSLEYLNSFNELINTCAISNSVKEEGDQSPEITDTGKSGGSYGVNGVWADLLRRSVVSSSTSSLSMNSFFDFLIEESYFGYKSRGKFSEIIEDEGFAKVLSQLPYVTKKNGVFLQSNNTNGIISDIQRIEKDHIYPQGIVLSPTYFTKQRAAFKAEVKEVRSELGRFNNSHNLNQEQGELEP
ncbi:MAG: hypothetical protein IJA61_01450 [Clostridia bacterium]|nr:hypothetical protein [Clostridia bacterium]